MKLGYACQNWTIGASTNNTFRLGSYSEEKLKKTVEKNLDALAKIIDYNNEIGFLFFRIGSSIVPFASHDICKFNWKDIFSQRLEEIGDKIKMNNMRISMHPDQFVLINSPKQNVVKKSVRELQYHCELLDLMGLDATAKVQIHVGGVYGDKKEAMNRFVENYGLLPTVIKKRLVIENDDRLFSLHDCLEIYDTIMIPIIFDNFHHQCLNNAETLQEGMVLAMNTWDKKDGVLMMDYSSQEPDARLGKHVSSINVDHFKSFWNVAKEFDVDMMLEIKDKEKSAAIALELTK